MHVVLALCSAAVAGCSDFVGGFASRKVPALVVNTCTHFVGIFAMLVAASVFAGDPTGTDVIWGLAAGLGSSTGLLSLYRGIAKASVAIVSPLAGVGAAALPVAYSVATGESLRLAVGVGVALGLVAIALVSLQPADAAASVRLSILYGLGAALGLGFLLLALGETTSDAGLWPVMYSRLSGFVVLFLIAVATRAQFTSARSAPVLLLVGGVLSASANGFFAAGAQIGPVATVAVVTAMFPAFTVLLARVVLKERLRPVQIVGLAVALVAIGLIAAG